MSMTCSVATRHRCRAAAPRLGAQHDPETLTDCLQSFLALDILRDADAPDTPRPIAKVEEIPLSTIVLNVNTGCNLACTYCCQEGPDHARQGQRWTSPPARASFELLLRQAHARDRVNVVFFGGEPLSNMPLIREVVAYAIPRAAELGKTVDFSLTTNATLLTPELVDWFDAHRFALTVSMDGPKALHDANRLTVGGRAAMTLSRAMCGCCFRATARGRWACG